MPCEITTRFVMSAYYKARTVELEHKIGDAFLMLDDAQTGDKSFQPGGAAWGPMVEATCETREHAEHAAKEFERILRKHKGQWDDGGYVL